MITKHQVQALPHQESLHLFQKHPCFYPLSDNNALSHCTGIFFARQSCRIIRNTLCPEEDIYIASSAATQTSLNPPLPAAISYDSNSSGAEIASTRPASRMQSRPASNRSSLHDASRTPFLSKHGTSASSVICLCHAFRISHAHSPLPDKISLAAAFASGSTKSSLIHQILFSIFHFSLR